MRFSLAFSTTKEVVLDPVENFIESINSGSVSALSIILVLNDFEKDRAIEFTENRLDDAAVGTTALRTAGEGLFPLDCQTLAEALSTQKLLPKCQHQLAVQHVHQVI